MSDTAIPTQPTDSPEVVLYTKPSCVQCTMTKRRLAQHGITPREVDITVDEAAYQYVLGLGFLQAPVVVVGDDAWAGFQPSKIDALVK